MTKSSFFKQKRFFILSIVITMAACNSEGDNKPTNADQSVEPVKTEASAAAVAPVGITTSKLDTLWVDSLNFTQLPKSNVVFSFYFGQLDTLTLHGWKSKGLCNNSFDADPDIKLIKGRPSATVTYGPETYFGNIILQKSQVKEIKKLLDSEKAQYVVFAPRRDGKNIAYTIYLSKDYPSILVKIFAIIPTGEEANPSPPKNS